MIPIFNIIVSFVTCPTQQVTLDQPGRCNVPRPLGVDLIAVSGISVSRVMTGSNEITSSVALMVEGISFVFAATTSTSKGNMISGVTQYACNPCADVESTKYIHHVV